ncbi:hypothetical protein [Planctomycetes bacterium Pan216]
MYANMRNAAIIALATTTILSGCGSAPDDGLIKHQVTGQVLVNGNPEKGVVVRFNHTDPSVKKNAARPIAVTDEDGCFVLSTNGEDDGAVAGTYDVTFFWPEGGNSMQEFFEGKYVKPNGPEFQVKVEDADALIPPFRLEAPAATVEKAHQALNKNRAQPIN